MDLIQKAKNIRKTILQMIVKSKSPHIGSAFSVVDILTYIYFKEIKKGDKVILSKGHAGSSLYATLAELGKIEKENLINTYSQNGSRFGGHITLGSMEGVDATAGSLGHGLSIGAGMALSLKDNYIYIIIGDGELNEGSIREALLFIATKKIQNVILIIDRNRQQGLGETNKIIAIPKLHTVLSDLGWNTIEVDGHDFNNIENGWKELSSEKPNVIIANTIKGKGMGTMENSIYRHYKTPDNEQFNLAFNNL